LQQFLHLIDCATERLDVPSVISDALELPSHQGGDHPQQGY
jgi:hypothetical protein